jgi:hypothetical protein
VGEGNFDADHPAESPWRTPASVAGGLDQARWVRRAAVHGFVDFNHVFQPRARGAAVTGAGAAVARASLTMASAGVATLRVAWDDDLVLRVNGSVVLRGSHPAFRGAAVEVPLEAGDNDVALKLSNTKGSNHGGWAYAFHAVLPDGTVLLPRAAASAAA